MTVQNTQRIQRKRIKGWSISAECVRLGCERSDIVYVGRGSDWGNPFEPQRTWLWKHLFPNEVPSTEKEASLFFFNKLFLGTAEERSRFSIWLREKRDWTMESFPVFEAKT